MCVRDPWHGQRDAQLQQVLDDMKVAGFPQTAWETRYRMLSCFRQGRLPEGLAHFHNLRSSAPSLGLSDYTIVVDSLLKHGFRAEAEIVLKDMEQNGLVPNLHLWTVFIQGYVNLGDMAGAGGIFDGLMQAGRRVDIPCCNILLNGYVKFGLVHRALSLLRLMLCSQQRSGDIGVGVDVVTLTTLLTYYVKRRQLSKCVLVLRLCKLSRLKPDIHLSNLVLTAYLITPHTLASHSLSKRTRFKLWRYSYTSIHSMRIPPSLILRVLRQHLMLTIQNHIYPDLYTLRLLLSFFQKYQLTSHAQATQDFLSQLSNTPTVDKIRLAKFVANLFRH
jgi:pentatricopeptide repeat protein